jgi:hypothetical protein
MDKFGWQRPNIESGKTGIQKAIEISRTQKRDRAANVIAQGNLISYDVVTGGGHNH